MESLAEQNTPTSARAASLTLTLGQQQYAAALQALGETAVGALQTNDDRLSGDLTLMVAESRRFYSQVPSGDDGLRVPGRIGCPYCRRRTYLVRVRPLGNLLSLNGHCTTCGTNSRQLMER